MRIPGRSDFQTPAVGVVLTAVLTIWSVAWTGQPEGAEAEKEDKVASWYVPRIATMDPTGRVISLKAGEGITLSRDVEPYQSLPEEQDWQRLPEPALSASTTKQEWSKAVIVFPCVLRADGIYKMWYMGNVDASRRATQTGLGYATSEDGVHWEEYPSNPILTSDRIPWARMLHMPFVVYDLNDRIYKMWFTGVTIERDEEGKVLKNVQHVGYGESPDGITRELHPEPVTRSGRHVPACSKRRMAFTACGSMQTLRTVQTRVPFMRTS